MKKVLALMLVLGMATAAQASMTALVVNGSSEYEPTPGETITIDLIGVTLTWSGCGVGGIVEASAVDGDEQAYDTDVVDMGGSISSPIANTGVTILAAGYVDNYMGNLSMGISADTTAGAIAAGTPTVSWEYTVSSSWDPDVDGDYWVACLKDGETYYYDGGSQAVGKSYSNLEAVQYLIQGLHILPEPATLALLGLGGLLLRRRR